MPSCRMSGLPRRAGNMAARRGSSMLCRQIDCIPPITAPNRSHDTSARTLLLRCEQSPATDQPMGLMPCSRELPLWLPSIGGVFS
jgi:hypothetical protein